MIWGAISAIGALLLLVLKIGIYFYKKNTKKATYEDDKQKLDDAIARGHVDDITSMFDDLRDSPEIKNNSSESGSKKIT